MTRRNLELALLCIAAPLAILLFAMIVVDGGQAISLANLIVPLGIFAAFISAHVACRFLAPGADPAILPLVFTLSSIGITFITRVNPDLAMNQIVWLFLGIILMISVLAFVRDLKKLALYKYTFMIAGLLFLLSPLIPGLGQEILGSRIWIHLGPFSFQPGEIAKIFIVLFLAGYLAQNREMLSVFTQRIGPFHLPDLRTTAPLLFMWVIALLVVIFEKDLGSALVFFFIFLIMLYATTGKKFYLVIGLGLALLGGFGAWMLFDHVQIRVATWLDPFADAQGKGYQLVQTLFALADGNLFGVGIGRGMASDIIPIVESDFIFAPIAEESGLLGAAGLLLLYLSFAIRGLVSAARAKTDVASFIACGMTSMIILQAFIIVGGVTRLIPLTGLTLPFISQGGSSLLASMIAVGFLLRCGDEGTGVSCEMEGTTSITNQGVLGRVSLGRHLTHIMIIFSVLFAMLVANLTLIMVVQAEEYRNMPSNNHALARLAKTERGTISTYDGVVLAKSVKQEDGTYLREYPAGDLASHVVGYTSARYGAAGIEASFNEALQGNTNFASWSDVVSAAAGIGHPGNDLRLTINSKIQQAAQNALKGLKGACVVLDPKTGAVLACVSNPEYKVQDIEKLLEEAASNPNGSSSLINRATQSLYAPGSTFKMLTLSTALEDNIAQENTKYKAPGKLEIGGGEITNFNDKNLGEISLARATELSSNTAFAQLGVQIGAKNLVESAEKFGFNQELKLEIASSKSLMPKPSEMTTWETAWAACGQPVGEHQSPAGPQASCLQMALVGSAIAYDGKIMKPYFVDSVWSPSGEKASVATPELFSQAIDANSAQRTRKILEGVVTSGTGTAVKVKGVTIAGKTGTAETGKPQDDSWFVGMAPADNPVVVVALVIEQSKLAPERSSNIFKEALLAQGVLGK